MSKSELLEAEAIAREIINHIINTDILISDEESVSVIAEPGHGDHHSSSGSGSLSQCDWLHAGDLPVDKESSELLCLDSEYVKKHLGIPLSLALAEILTKRPSDPIHYLGHWLLKWRWNQEQKQRHEDKIHALIAERKRIADEAEEKLREKEELQRRALQRLREEAEQAAKEQLEIMFNNMQLREIKPEGDEGLPANPQELPGELHESSNDNVVEEEKSDESLNGEDDQ